MTRGTQTAKRGAKIAPNAPVMVTYPTALVLAKRIQTLAVPALVAALRLEG
jgi:hypothetical protein